MVWVLRPSQFLKRQLWCPEWVQVADIPGCLESWPGEPGLGKRQPDAGAPDPEEEAVGGGKESSLADSLPDNNVLMVLMNLLASELTRKILQHFSTFSWCIVCLANIHYTLTQNIFFSIGTSEGTGVEEETVVRDRDTEETTGDRYGPRDGHVEVLLRGSGWKTPEEQHASDGLEVETV